MPQRNKPLFSVIVPAYNVEEYISQCIESVLTQSFQDFELILVDDGSTDHTGEICDSYGLTASNRASCLRGGAEATAEHAARESRNDGHERHVPHKQTRPITSGQVHIIHQKNQGLSASRNTGVAKASGEYLIFLDGDDYFEQNALEIIQKSLEPDLDLLRYQAQEVFPDGREVKYPESGFATTSGINAFKKISSYHYTENAWLYAYRRNFFVENKFEYAPGCLAEDLGLTPLIIARANKIKAILDICYNYRQREGSIMHDEAKISRRINDIAKQYQKILPEIATIPHTESILHYLVVSFLTGATELERDKFLAVYREAKESGMLKYIHPDSIKAVPRSVMLKHFPKLFYRVYH